MASPSVAATSPCDEHGSVVSRGVIRVRGARTHNLCDVDLDVPRGRLVVFTGVSGCGKSSLAFDTIHAEGSRQYLETLSSHARRFVEQLERADVDEIEGLPPTMAVDQTPVARNPRSTVGTTTEILAFLSVLAARIGEPTCPDCGVAARPQTVEQIVEQVQQQGEGVKAMLLAPLVRGRKGAHAEVLEHVRKAGFVRIRLDGEIHDVEQAPEISPRKTHDIDAVIDRIVIRAENEARTEESVRLALRHGEGRMIALFAIPQDGNTTWEERLFSTLSGCPGCGRSFPELDPRSFSFNSPYGACPRCEGLGVVEDFDPDLVVPNWERSPARGAFPAWSGAPAAAKRKLRSAVRPWLESQGRSWSEPLSLLNAKQRKTLLRGDGAFLGLLPLLAAEWSTCTDADRLAAVEAFRMETTCEACRGARLSDEARSVLVGGLGLHEVAAMSVERLIPFLQALKPASHLAAAAEPLLRESITRLRFLEQVGLSYLSLDRAAHTLSGGELQRVRLAASIGAGLAGVCYVLDEPSIGLHPRDDERLIAAMRELVDRGASVLVVEHDEAVMRAADWIVDLGPGAGRSGGSIVAQGEPAEVAKASCATGDFLGGRRRIAAVRRRRDVSGNDRLRLAGCTLHNLRDVVLEAPLGAFVCVTGVSGSGKSSLIQHTLAPALVAAVAGGSRPGAYRSLSGAESLDRVLSVDQTPIGRSPRSNPATYTGVYGDIRELFAACRESKLRGYSAGRFSFNTGDGRCEACDGRGAMRLEIDYLPDFEAPCPRCRGARFNGETLRIRFKGRNIAEVLAMTIDEAAEFFSAKRSIAERLAVLQQVGLGYLQLGQPATTLSGGEAQRMKLACELMRPSSGRTLFLFDEPTTGLHLADVERLLGVLQQLCDRGGSVIVVEHHLDVIASSDWVIDLGPGAGEHGGTIVAAGPPESVARVEASITGRFLAERLK